MSTVEYGDKVYPCTLDVGATRLDVYWSQEAWDEQMKKDGTVKDDDQPLGLHVPPESNIFIKPGQSISEMQDTLLHEVLHAIWHQAVNTSAVKEFYDLQEFIIQSYTPWIRMVMKDNPDVMWFLLNGPTRRPEPVFTLHGDGSAVINPKDFGVSSARLLTTEEARERASAMREQGVAAWSRPEDFKPEEKQGIDREKEAVRRTQEAFSDTPGSEERLTRAPMPTHLPPRAIRDQPQA